MSPRRHLDDDHEQFDEMAVGWALHALEPEDEAVFGQHLDGCARCARTVSDTGEVMAAMATDLPAAEPSPALRDRLRAAVAETEQVPGAAGRPAGDDVAAAPAPQVAQPSVADVADVVALPRHGARTRRPSRTRGWRGVAPRAVLAAGVAAVLGLGVWNVTLVRDRDAAQATAASQASMMSALLAPGEVTVAPMEHDGRTVATVVARDGQAQVVVDGMSVNDTATSTYVLWGVTADGPEALGTFDVVSGATDLRTVGSEATGLGDFSAYAISLEPGRQAPTEPTDVVANGQVTS
ncbi:anti-sigma factor [Klenkia sp. LSe6-5]|uniref:Regulator of SigK n=1 Tax=Klenkia sesuvii TaxID=3103137 RepID=A0ABU8DSA8_9ACTN